MQRTIVALVAITGIIIIIEIPEEIVPILLVNVWLLEDLILEDVVERIIKV